MSRGYPAGSKPFAGSSSTISAGSLSSAAARPSRCRIPSEYLRTFSSPRSSRPTSASASSTRLRPMRSIAPSKRRFSRPVIVGNIAGVSTMAPISCMTSVRPRGLGRPSRVSSPADGRARPSKHRMVVVFPEPFGPRKPKTPPSGTSRSSPETAMVGPPRRRRYSLRSPSMLITGVTWRTDGRARLAGDACRHFSRTSRSFLGEVTRERHSVVCRIDPVE